MKISTKIRLLVAMYSSLPLLIVMAIGRQLNLYALEEFQIVVASGVGALIVTMAALPMPGLGWIFLRQFRRISRNCDQIKRGRYTYFELPNQPIEGREENEFDYLMRDMNWMIRQIANREKDLETQVARRTAALCQVNEELLAAKEAADASSMAKGRFLATMSHEIRTPMNAIIGLSESLVKSELSAQQRKHVEIIRDASRSLMRILNDVLDYSRIDAGKMELEAVPLSLPELLAGVVDLFRHEANEKGIDLIINIPDNLPDDFEGDPLRLRQVLMNLVSNAVKFTEDGMVSVSAKALELQESDALLLFSVSDTGIGMTPAATAAIFDAFTQADGSTTRKYGGTGLGMAICSRLTELMEGQLCVESKEGVGSQFDFEIRLKRRSAREGTLQPQPERFNDCSISAVSQEHTKQPVCHEFDPINILIVDDNVINHTVAMEVLSSYHLSADTVISGVEAIRAVQQKPYALVLMDIRMDGMDGYETTRRLRAIPGMKSLPIVALTAGVGSRERQEALSNGMDDFLSKPIEPDMLLSVLRRWCCPFKLENHDGDLSCSACSLEEADNTLTGFDLNRGIRNWRGKKRAYFRTIVSGVDDFARAVDETEIALKSNNRKKAAFILHRLKGSLGAVFAMNALAAVSDLESALETDDSALAISALARVRQELAVVIASAEKLKILPEVQSTAIENRVSGEATTAIVNKLDQAIRRNSLMAGRYCDELKSVLSQGELEKELEQLERSTRCFDFTGAGEALSLIATRLNISASKGD